MTYLRISEEVSPWASYFVIICRDTWLGVHIYHYFPVNLVVEFGITLRGQRVARLVLQEGHEAFPLCIICVFGTVDDKAVMLLWGSILIGTV
jgi:hypothetical protein